MGSMAKAGAGFVADLFAQLVGGIQAAVIAPLALALGCQAADSDASSRPAPPVVEVKVTKKPPPADNVPRQIGFFNITFYYVAGEAEIEARLAKKRAQNQNEDETAETDTDEDTAGTELASVAPRKTVTVHNHKCGSIAEVSPEFFQQLRVQGTGKLRDGRMLNVWGRCDCETSPCFKEISHQWGNAGNGRPLQPFRTVAVDPKVVKLGSLLYVPLLEGRTMPGRAPWGGYVHDGCVVADDTGGGIKGEQLDLFVGRKGWFLGLSGSRGSHAWARHVPVFDGSKVCERKGRRVSRKAGGV